jgi:hypothetical protein
MCRQTDEILEFVEGYFVWPSTLPTNNIVGGAAAVNDEGCAKYKMTIIETVCPASMNSFFGTLRI